MEYEKYVYMERIECMKTSTAIHFPHTIGTRSERIGSHRRMRSERIKNVFGPVLGKF
jgi:hypothetical protein